MRKVGEVVLILNSKFALIKASEPLILGSEITVYSQFSSNLSGLSTISIPKGKLKILMLQESNYYLVSVITKKIAIETNENQSLARSLSVYSTIFGEDSATASDIVGEVANYSAKLETKEALNITLNNLVKVGDSVAFQTGGIPDVAEEKHLPTNQNR